MHFFFNHSWHQPLTAIARYLVQRKKWHGHGHAITWAARLKMVAELQGNTRNLHRFWKDVSRDARSFMPHQLFFIQIQRLLCFFARVLMPLFQLHNVIDIRWNNFVVEGNDQLLIDQYINTA